MNPTIYNAKTSWGASFRWRADLEQAGAPIQVESSDEPGGWINTPYQTADARHREDEARALILDWLVAE
jgi:hypothetical protein